MRIRNSVHLGEWWLPQAVERRVSGALVCGEKAVLRLHSPIESTRSEETYFEPAIYGVCEGLGDVLLLDSWVEGQPSWSKTFGGYQSFVIRPQSLLLGRYPSSTSEPVFTAATFGVSGLFGWMRHKAPRLEPIVSDQGGVSGWHCGLPVSIVLSEDSEVRASVRLGLSGQSPNGALREQVFTEEALLVIESKAGPLDLSELWAACVRMVRLIELLRYETSEVEVDCLDVRGGDGRPIQMKSFRRSAEVLTQTSQSEPAVSWSFSEADWVGVCRKWNEVLDRDALPYHRLSSALSHSGTQELEGRFQNICSAIAAWVEHGGGSKSGAAKAQLEEVLEIGRQVLSVRWTEGSGELAKAARHYLTHGSTQQRPPQMYAQPEFLWGWIRRLTASLWAAVMRELGLPEEVLRAALSRSTRLRYDAMYAGLPRITRHNR